MRDEEAARFEQIVADSFRGRREDEDAPDPT
jgi:hypothetical protein